MATTTLTLGAVSLQAGVAGLDPHTQSAVVGSPPQWADGSDATYARVNNRTHDSALWSGRDFAVAPLDAFTAASVTAITVTIRASSSGVGTTFFVGDIFSTAGGRTSDPFASLDTPDFARGSIQTITGTFPDDDEDPAFNSLVQATAALAAGASLSLGAGFFGNDLTIYEASLTVTYADTTKPATRLYPRKDNLGPLGSAPRLVGDLPPERLIRY